MKDSRKDSRSVSTLCTRNSSCVGSEIGEVVKPGTMEMEMELETEMEMEMEMEMEVELETETETEMEIHYGHSRSQCRSCSQY